MHCMWWQPCNVVSFHVYIPVIPPVVLGDGMSVLVVVVFIVVLGGGGGEGGECCGTSFTITVLLSFPLIGVLFERTYI